MLAKLGTSLEAVQAFVLIKDLLELYWPDSHFLVWILFCFLGNKKPVLCEVALNFSCLF